MMDTKEILGYFRAITRCKPYAQYAVVPSDKLKYVKIIRYPLLLCINLDEARKPGSHWVGMYIARNGGELEFFDSYGISINSYPSYFREFAVKNRLKVIESKTLLQSPISSVCGHYVVFYMLKRLKSCSREAFYRTFSNNLNKNDIIVYNFVKKILIIKPINCKFFQICK